LVSKPRYPFVKERSCKTQIRVRSAQQLFYIFTLVLLLAGVFPSRVIGSSSVPPMPATTYSLIHFGNAGYGGDDTNVFQTALNYTAQNGDALEIPAGSYNISPIFFPSNSYVIVDANVIVSANIGYSSTAEMLNINSGPVTIVGAGSSTSVFQMPNAQAASIADGSQYRHCLEIGNGGAASNVTISGIACNESGGDGIYIRNATNVTVENCLFDRNYRNGGSITGQVNGITLSGNYFTNTNGTLPKSGSVCLPAGQEEFSLEVGVLVASRTTAPPKRDEAAEAEFKAKTVALAPKYRTEC
jgi:parallel beta-helix repeat protein